MSISIVAAGAFSFANNAAVTPSLGGTSLANDLAVVLGGICAAGTGDSFATPSGYTQDDVNGGSTAHQQYAWHKIAGASEANPTITPSGGATNDVMAAAALLLRGVDTITPIHAHRATAAFYSASPMNTPTLTVANDNCCVLAMVFWNGTASAFGNFDPNSDGAWTVATAFASQTFGSQSLCGRIYSRIQTAHADIAASTVAATGGTFSQGIVQLVAYNAAAAGGPSLAQLSRNFPRALHRGSRGR